MEVNGMKRKEDKQNISVNEEITPLVESILLKEEKIQHLNQQINENNKRIKHIEQSNTWKFSKVFRKIKRFLTRLFSSEKTLNKQQYIAQLENKLTEAENELFKTKELNKKLRLTDAEFNKSQIHQFIREMRNEGEL